MPRRTTTHPTSVRLSDETRRQLAELGGSLSDEIAAAVVERHQRRVTGVLWQGAGAWQGWSLSTSHAASSYGQPVLVRPDGVALGPGDITPPSAR